MALKRQLNLNSSLVASRALEFPVIQELLGERLETILGGKSRRAEASPLLLRLLEQTGENSRAMLELFSEGIVHFDSIDPPGWREWRGTLAGAERIGLLARYFELLTARWFTASGYKICAFEPVGAPGRRADLLVALDDEELLIETTSPGPHKNDWVEEAMDHLILALSRVESGLIIDVEGYESLSFDPGGEWGAVNSVVATQQREELVAEFARAAEKLDHSKIPQVIISPSPSQPITITATKHMEERERETVVVAGWSRSGLVPNVKRLAQKILDERKHLPDAPHSMILIDLSRWGDFRSADYYLREVAKLISGRVAPASFVSTCVGTHGATEGGVRQTHWLIERGVLAADPTWSETPLGQHLRDRWGGGDYTEAQPSDA